MYIAVRKYYIVPGAVDEWMQRVQRGLVPIISQVPDFIAFYALKVREDVAVTVSIFDTQAGAEESVRQAVEWVATHIAPLNQCLPEITAGHVQAQSGPLSFPVRSEDLVSH